ncbi:50S ribosomal protein L21 [Patescibacteria group bacterium]
MLAVIQTGGKQYLVSPGKIIKIEKLEKKEGSEVVFDKVLLLEKSNKLEIGNPFISGVKILGKVLSQGKGKKIIVFKYRAKTRRKTKKGHRQAFTEVEIKKLTETSKK